MHLNTTRKKHPTFQKSQQKQLKSQNNPSTTAPKPKPSIISHPKHSQFKHISPQTSQHATFLSKLRKKGDGRYSLPAVNPDEFVLSYSKNHQIASKLQKSLNKTISDNDSNNSPTRSDRDVLGYTCHRATGDRLGRFWSKMSNDVKRLNPDNVSNDQLISDLFIWMKGNGAYIHPFIKVKSSSRLVDEDKDTRQDNPQSPSSQSHHSTTQSQSTNTSTPDEPPNPLKVQGDGVTDNNWGLFAMEKIPQYTIIAAIPYPMMIQQTFPYSDITQFKAPIDDTLRDSNDYGGRDGVGKKNNAGNSKNDQDGLKEQKNSKNNNTTNNHTQKFSIPDHLFKKISSFPQGTLVVLFLHLCNLTRSPYKAFLSTLPMGYPTLLGNNISPFSPSLKPLSTDSRMNIQTGTSIGLLDDFNVTKDFIEKHVGGDILNGNEFDFATFQILKNILDSRGFSGQNLLDNNLTPEVLLIPLLDLLNNSSVNNVAHVSRELGKAMERPPKPLFPQKEGLFPSDPKNTPLLHYLITLSDIEPGDELFYGYQQSIGDQWDDSVLRHLPTLLTKENQEEFKELGKPLGMADKKFLRKNDFFSNLSQNNSQNLLTIIDQNKPVLSLHQQSQRPKLDKLIEDQRFPQLKQDRDGDQDVIGVNNSQLVVQNNSSLTSASTFSSPPNVPLTSSPPSYPFYIRTGTRNKPKFSPHLTNLLANLTHSNPLSDTSIPSTIRFSLGRYPFLSSDDLLQPLVDTPFPHTTLLEKYGIISHGLHRPYYIDVYGSKMSEDYYHIKPSFFINLENTKNIIESASSFYNEALTSHGLDQIVNDPEYLSYIRKIRRRHADFVQKYEPSIQQKQQKQQNNTKNSTKDQQSSDAIDNSNNSPLKPGSQEPMKLPRRDRMEILNKIAFPLSKAAPLPFSSVLFLNNNSNNNHNNVRNTSKNNNFDLNDDDNGTNGGVMNNNNNNNNIEGTNDHDEQHASTSTQIELSHPLQQSIHLVSKLMVERMDTIEQHGCPESSSRGTKTKNPAKNTHKNDETDLGSTNKNISSLLSSGNFRTLLESDYDTQETINQVKKSQKFLSSHFNSKNTPKSQTPKQQFFTTIPSVFRPPRQRVQSRVTLLSRLLPRSVINPFSPHHDEHDTLSMAYPFRYGLTTISPQLEAYCYLLAAHTCKFDEISREGYEVLIEMVQDAVEGKNVTLSPYDDDSWEEYLSQNSIDDLQSGDIKSIANGNSSKEKKKSEWKKRNLDKRKGFFLRLFSPTSPSPLPNKTSTEQIGPITQDNNVDGHDFNVGMTKKVNMVTNLGRLSKFGDVNTKTNKNKPNNQKEVDMIAQLHLPAYAIFLGIIDTVMRSQGAGSGLGPNRDNNDNNKNIDHSNHDGDVKADNPDGNNDDNNNNNNQSSTLPAQKSTQNHPKFPFSPRNNGQSTEIDDLNIEFGKIITNVPNYALQHLFNSVATKIGVENHYYDLDALMDNKEPVVKYEEHQSGGDGGYESNEGNDGDEKKENDNSLSSLSLEDHNNSSSPKDHNNASTSSSSKKNKEHAKPKVYSPVATPVSWIPGDIISNFGNKYTD